LEVQSGTSESKVSRRILRKTAHRDSHHRQASRQSVQFVPNERVNFVVLPTERAQQQTFAASAAAVAGAASLLSGSRQGRRYLCKIPTLKVEGHVHQPNQGWDLNQWPDDRGKCRTRVDSKYGHSHRDGKFEVVACSGE